MDDIFTVLLGAAGTGKTTLIKARLSENPRYGIKTAVTGIAAVNLQDENGTASTINSVLGYYDTKDLLFKYVGGVIQPKIANIANDYDRLIIDEVSMMEAPQLTLLHRIITEYNEKADQPLGLELVGDFGQLPPVNGKPAFQSPIWKDFKLMLLTKVKRQGDKEFINALSNIRLGNVAEVIDYIESSIGFHENIDDNFKGSTFFSKNADVDKYNAINMEKLKGKSRSYTNKKYGYQRTEWKNIPNVLTLKKNCLVVILMNSAKYGYVNGDLGWVEEMTDDVVLVRLKRNNLLVPINYTTIKSTGPNNESGYITYLPIRVAFAMTVHKSQGLTLDAVQIKVGDNFMRRTHAMLYVALSRCRTKEGLRIVGDKDSFIKSVCTKSLYTPYIL